MPQLAVLAERVSKYFPKSGRLEWRDALMGIPPERRFVALDGVSLQVPRGEVMGILGRNGAGKSTLLRVLGGVYAPDRGMVAIGGDTAGLFELGGFGNAELTGLEFAQRFLQLFGVPRAQWPELVEGVREFSELGAYFEERIRTYSAGMSARLFFAVATAVPHEIYLIDEILSVGDEHFQTKSWARMREHLANGASGVLVTHDWSAVIKLCRQSKALAGGRVVLEGRSDTVVAGYLDLAQPDAGRAKLLVEPEAVFGAASEQDWVLSYEVEVLAPGPVETAVSIEALQLGVGWEPVILTEYQRVADQPGRYRVEVAIGRLPLAPGEYTLNLFLATGPDPASGARLALDARGWTYGNGVLLRVSGEATPGVAPLPLHWLDEAFA